MFVFRIKFTGYRIWIVCCIAVLIVRTTNLTDTLKSITSLLESNFNLDLARLEYALMLIEHLVTFSGNADTKRKLLLEKSQSIKQFQHQNTITNVDGLSIAGNGLQDQPFSSVNTSDCVFITA